MPIPDSKELETLETFKLQKAVQKEALEDNFELI